MKKTWSSRDFFTRPFDVVLAVTMVFVLGGCAPAATQAAASKQETQAAQVAKRQTEIALYTPTPISTAHPAERPITDVINSYIEASEDALSKTFDASYRVVRVSFSPDTAGNLVGFSVALDCTCPRDTSCCSPEHAFVLVARAMNARKDAFPAIIPATVNDFRVECYDHRALVGFMAAPWLRMREYLAGTIGEEQLSWALQRSPTPKP